MKLYLMALIGASFALAGATRRVAPTDYLQDSTGSEFITVGLCLGSIEEGARIFTPTRFLPFEHPEAKGHQLPTVLQFHGGEDRLLDLVGKQAGLKLAVTLQRYPVEPDTLWPYAPFKRPPISEFENISATHRSAKESPLPGLRAVAYWNGFPLAFIIDTRGMSLSERHMNRATSVGLDVTRGQIMEALTAVEKWGQAEGAWMVVFDHP